MEPFCRDVIGENIILGDTRGGGGWGIDADFVGVSNIEHFFCDEESIEP